MTLHGVPDFSKLRVAVLGDAIADHYVVCEPRSLSREAPVMVLRHAHEYVGAGGAANVARNLRALGATTSIFGVVGRDARGRELAELLENDGVDATGLVTVAGWLTPTKTRVVAAEPRRNLQQVLRIDREPQGPAPREVRAGVVERLLARANEFDALVLSDYEYGSIDAELGRAAVSLAKAGKIVVLDPRATLAGFEGLTALTPNVGEMARFTRRDPDELVDVRALADSARELLERVPTRWLLVTRGNLGMALFGEGVPAEGASVDASGSGNVTDPTGAGDTAAAVFALALAAGLDAPNAMRLANAASGVVVMASGCAVCSREELRAALAVAPSPVRLFGVEPL
ncbi:MAG: sugar kinase [Planctomycetes bacterium]|nr:sugar kinase [Planctomycetota bacterium]